MASSALIFARTPVVISQVGYFRYRTFPAALFAGGLVVSTPSKFRDKPPLVFPGVGVVGARPEPEPGPGKVFLEGHNQASEGSK